MQLPLPADLDWSSTAPTHLVEVAIRLAGAAFLGGLIGLDRETKRRAAGLRTHMMVAVGAALFTLVVVEEEKSGTVLSYLVKGLATGIGFLGAGAILKTEHGVEGLTTAATIWVTAAVGLAVGAGSIWLAIMGTVVSLVVLVVVARLAPENSAGSSQGGGDQ